MNYVGDTHRMQVLEDGVAKNTQAHPVIVECLPELLEIVHAMVLVNESPLLLFILALSLSAVLFIHSSLFNSLIFTPPLIFVIVYAILL